jgi:methylated-DNA-protein-cysteine methyltransferase-like protein
MQTEAERALFEKIYLVIEQIPHGSVATYGDIAAVVGVGCDGRMVGAALRALATHRSDQVPWQRVISRDGVISTTGLGQRRLLEAEGVAFDAQDRAILARHRWPGPSDAWAAANHCQILPPHTDSEQLSLL